MNNVNFIITAILMKYLSYETTQRIFIFNRKLIDPTYDST